VNWNLGMNIRKIGNNEAIHLALALLKLLIVIPITKLIKLLPISENLKT